MGVMWVVEVEAEWLGRLRREAHERRSQLRTSINSLRSSRTDTLEALLGLIGSDEPERLAHARRVAALAHLVGARLGLTRQQLALLSEAALLHDLGKLGVPQTILRKPAPLTFDEEALVRQHRDIAVQTLATLGGFDAAASILRASNVCFDARSWSCEAEVDPIRLSGHIH